MSTHPTPGENLVSCPFQESAQSKGKSGESEVTHGTAARHLTFVDHGWLEPLEGTAGPKIRYRVVV
jgi:hypothetical protein